MKPRPETEDLDDLLETTKAIRATERRHVRSLDDFIAACAASPNLERMGGLAVDMTTKSMVTQVWAALQKHDNWREIGIPKLRTRFDNIAAKHKVRLAILDLVDRFWKITR
jgi:hypothetical protein